MTDPQRAVGFVGLGNMGGALAANLAGTGLSVIGYDAAGPDRAPAGVEPATDLGTVARGADVIVLSLPDGSVSRRVAADLLAVADRRVAHVIDTSTVGVEASRQIDALLDDGGVAYVDAPVSGGPAGARARTLAVMVAGADDAVAAVEPVLAGLSDRRFRVGDRPGMGQAMKLANNFLSAVALAATSEAVAFGRAAGLDMSTMLDVLAASSGRNSAVDDKFPNHVLTGTYASGFTSTLMAKDIALYLGSASDLGGPTRVGSVVARVWEDFAAAQPGVDFTRVFPFVADS